jgi:hypothetical protein
MTNYNFLLYKQDAQKLYFTIGHFSALCLINKLLSQPNKKNLVTHKHNVNSLKHEN